MNRKTPIFYVAPLVAALYSVGASALPSVTTAFVAGQQQWSDDSAEVLVDNDGDGVLSKGDYLVGFFGITSFPTSGVAANSVNEYTGIFATEVLEDPVAVPSAVCAAGYAGSCASFSFGTTGDFNAAIASAATVIDLTDDGILNGSGPSIGAFLQPNGGALGADTVALFIEDSTPDFDRDGGTQTTAFESAADGIVRLAIELVAANGDGWTGTGPTDLADFGLVDSGTGIGSFSINATITDQGFNNWTFDPNITANGSIKPTSASPFIITDDTTFEVNVTQIPEPGALALLSLGLLGVGVGASRKRKLG